MSRRASDEELLLGFQEGDAQAFEQLLQRYRDPIFAFILRSTRDPDRARDLTQDVFLRVVQRSDQFQAKAKFSTWLYAIARNICIDHGRKMSFRRHKSLDSVRGDEGSPMVERVASGQPETDRRAIAKQFQKDLAQAVGKLPDDQRDVFLMRQIQGMPFRDIADTLQVSENTAKSRMRYALERLQGALGEYREYLRELRKV